MRRRFPWRTIEPDSSYLQRTEKKKKVIFSRLSHKLLSEIWILCLTTRKCCRTESSKTLDDHFKYPILVLSIYIILEQALIMQVTRLFCKVVIVFHGSLGSIWFDFHFAATKIEINHPKEKENVLPEASRSILDFSSDSFSFSSWLNFMNNAFGMVNLGT